MSHKNPFDILPARLFNLLGTQGGMQRHYTAILLRLYGLAEFNRYGLTREQVIAEISDYLTAEGLEAIPDYAQTDPDDPTPTNPRDYAGWILRRLEEAGWIEREQQADYTELITLPDYAFTLLEAFRSIQEQKPREYTGKLYAAFQLINNQRSKDFSPAFAVSEAYENVREVVRGLNELNQNIRRYIERVTQNKSVADLLRLQYDDYAQSLGPSYHALKTADHVSRYRRSIIDQFQRWQLNAQWLNKTADELATQKRHLTPAQARAELENYLRFVVNQLEGLDPLLEQIDRRHGEYIRTSLRQIRYQLVSGDGGFKDKLVNLANYLAEMQAEGEDWLPDEAPSFLAAPIAHPDGNSYYTPRQKRAPFTPELVARPTLNPGDIQSLRRETLHTLSRVVTPAKVQAFVEPFFNGKSSLHASDLPASAFAQPDDMPWLIYLIAYGNHPQVNYHLEALDGERVAVGIFFVRPFRLVKR